MTLVEKAKEIAYKAHAGQVDKAGKPYTNHIDFVAEHVDTEAEKCVAYLHDVMEDTDYPPEKLMEEFGVEIYDALIHMTHHEDEDYFDYVNRVSDNAISTKVKMADLTHNMKLDRLPEVTEKDKKRVEKYKKAYELLEAKIKV